MGVFAFDNTRTSEGHTGLKRFILATKYGIFYSIAGDSEGEIWKSRGRRRRVLLRSSIKLYAVWWLAYLERSMREIAWIYELKYARQPQ